MSRSLRLVVEVGVQSLVHTARADCRIGARALRHRVRDELEDRTFAVGRKGSCEGLNVSRGLLELCPFSSQAQLELSELCALLLEGGARLLDGGGRLGPLPAAHSMALGQAEVDQLA